jgi:deoxycytidylate deaminase
MIAPNRPTWDETFMSMALVYCLRSPDPATKHGAIIVDSQHHPMGWGYNGYPKGGTIDLYPTTRPAKYRHIAHSELNALLNRTINTKGGTVYVTGHPCCGCMVAMIQASIREIIYGKIGSHCVNKEDWDAVNLMSVDCGVKLTAYSGRYPVDIYNEVKDYLKLKEWTE